VVGNTSGEVAERNINDVQVQEHQRVYLVKRRLAGASIAKAARDANIPYEVARRIFNSEETGELLMELTKRRRTDLVELWDRVVDSMVEDTKSLDLPAGKQGGTIECRQNLRAEALEILKFANPPQLQQTQNANAGTTHVTYQTLVQIAMAAEEKEKGLTLNYPPNTSSGQN
jgi:hypothetical protein